MFKKYLALLAVTLMVSPAIAADTAKGKIISSQGHESPNCRTVGHKENVTGTIRYFRIMDVAGEDDVAQIVLSSLMSKRDVTIHYDTNLTSGCGTEPRIIYVTAF
jgi:hypothetical protein